MGCFTEDCVLESPVMGVYRGHQGIRDFVAPNVRIMQERGGQFRHVVTNLRIEVDGDRAKAKCYLLDFLTVGGETRLLSPGVYECDVLNSGGEWRFQTRYVKMDYNFPKPETL